MNNTYTVEQLRLMVMEVNEFDSSLDNLEFFEMEELDDVLTGLEPTEILRMAHFGDFNWNDEYFQINVYGNLDSANSWDIEDYQDEIVDRYNELIENEEIENIL